MAEGDKRRTPSREVPSTGKIYKTSLETRMENLRLRESSAREGRMNTFGGLDGGTDARRTLGGPISSHQTAGARPKTGLLSGPSSSTTSGRSTLAYFVKSRTEKAKMVPTPLSGSPETSHRGLQAPSLEKNGKRGPGRESPKATYGTGDLRYDFEPQGTGIRAQVAPCLYCKGSHGFAECSTFAKLTHEVKLDTIRKAGLCFACLDKGHRSQDCKSKLVCPICTENTYYTNYHPQILHKTTWGIFEQVLEKQQDDLNDMMFKF